MCVKQAGPVGGKPLEYPPEAGPAPPPDMVGGQEVAPQSDRQRLAAEAKADYDAQPQPTNWRNIKPKDRGNKKIFSQFMNFHAAPHDPKDSKRALLKLNPDGSAAMGHSKEYYADPDNWWSREDLGLPNLPESDINI